METWEWILLLIGGLIIAVVMQGYLGNMNVPVSYIIYITAILSFWESENIMRVLKLQSSKLVATNFDTTTDGRYIPAGDYAIFTLGDIDAYFHFKGKKGALIVPRDAINKLGRHVVCTVNPKEVYYNELPPTVRDRIKQLQLEPPYYMGWVSERMELVEPSTTRMEQELAEQNTLLNMLRDIGKGKFETVGDLIEFVKKVKEETKEKSWLQKVLGGEEERKDENK